MTEEIATAADTIAALLEGSTRSALPMCHAFVQTRGRGGSASGGPLASFVRSHHGRCLDQYLLFHSVASGTNFAVARPATVWARALSFGSGPSAVAAVSKNWAWLSRHIRRSTAQAICGQLGIPPV